MKDDWDEQYSIWKKDNPGGIKRRLIRLDLGLEDIKREVTGIKQRTVEYVKEPRHIKVIKILLLLIPLIILGYIAYFNLLHTGDFSYFYNIGTANENYLSPKSRVSEINNVNGISYRNITNGLVYFDVPLVRGAETVKIDIRFGDYFPEYSKLIIGAKDQEIWHYQWNTVYNGAYENISDIRQIDQSKLDEFESLVIGTDQLLELKENRIKRFSPKNHTINTGLRGGHKFYVYLKDKLDINVKKQDINWYNGTDELNVLIYDSSEKLIGNFSIEDDGINGTEKTIPRIQEGGLRIDDIKEGVYRIEFMDFDGIIREIKINSDKIVAVSQIYLADSSVFFPDIEKPSKIYTNLSRKGEIVMKTWHDAALQDVLVNNVTYRIEERVKETIVGVDSGISVIESQKNDIIVSVPGYIAFSNDSYFEPFNHKIVPLKQDRRWIENNLDYIIVNYISPKYDNGWFVASTSFDVKDIYIKNNKANFAINVPHLGSDLYVNNTIPIDWINITIYKKGLAKMGWKR